MSEAVDYKALLLKYAQHVKDTEGAHFLARSERWPGQFSDAENEALDEIKAAIDGKPPQPELTPEADLKIQQITGEALRVLHGSLRWRV